MMEHLKKNKLRLEIILTIIAATVICIVAIRSLKFTLPKFLIFGNITAYGKVDTWLGLSITIVYLMSVRFLVKSAPKNEYTQNILRWTGWIGFIGIILCFTEIYRLHGIDCRDLSNADDVTIPTYFDYLDYSIYLTRVREQHNTCSLPNSLRFLPTFQALVVLYYIASTLKYVRNR